MSDCTSRKKRMSWRTLCTKSNYFCWTKCCFSKTQSEGLVIRMQLPQKKPLMFPHSGPAPLETGGWVCARLSAPLCRILPRAVRSYCCLCVLSARNVQRHIRYDYLCLCFSHLFSWWGCQSSVLLPLSCSLGYSLPLPQCCKVDKNTHTQPID